MNVKKKREELISNIIGGFFATLFMMGFFLMFLIAWVEEDKNWNPPVAKDNAYTNVIDNPYEERWVQPKE